MAESISYHDEAHMQDIISDNLEVIPFEDVQPESAKLKRIAIKELGLPGSGSTDIVVVDQNGTIFIIETKLAKNPEAKRQVIGQILEYAAFLWDKDFEWLDSLVRSKRGKSLAESFQENQDWVKETFEEAVANHLQEGSFKLIIVVDKLNLELQKTTQFMKDKLSVEIYPIELRYFKDKNGTEILLPKVLSSQVSKPSTTKLGRAWDEASFFDDATSKLDGDTVATIRKLYAFGKELGEVNWGKGITHGTFQVRISYGDESISLFVISSTGEKNWFGFKKLTELGADKAVLTKYIENLRSIGFQLNEARDWNRYPEFVVSALAKDGVFASFKEKTLELKQSLLYP